MKFDLMGIILMAIAIFVANIVGPMVAGMVGMAGGLIGAFIIGLVAYLVYCLLTGQSIRGMTAVIFALAVYVSGIVTAYISSFTGFGGGIISVILQAVVLSLIFGYFFKGKMSSPIQAKGTSKRRRR